MNILAKRVEQLERLLSGKGEAPDTVLYFVVSDGKVPPTEPDRLTGAIRSGVPEMFTRGDNETENEFKHRVTGDVK